MNLRPAARRAVGAASVVTAALGIVALPAHASTPPPSQPGAPTTQPTSTTTTVPPTTTTTTAVATTTTTTSTTTTTAPTTTTLPPTGATTSAPSTPVTSPTTTAAPAPTCRPATTTTTTTTTTTLPGATTTTTTTTTTLPGATTTTTTTTTTIPLPDCPTTTTSSTTAVATTEPPDAATVDPNAPAPAPLGVPVPKRLGDILVTIRLIESGNNYGLPKNRGGASGAYQYIDSTWNNYAGFPSAYLAPPHVQDERALADVQSILRTWNNDVSMVPVIWYYPKAAREPALMDEVPMPQAGNRLTVRQYQLRWLEMLAQVSGEPLNLALRLPPDLKYLAGIPPELTSNPASAVAGPEGLMLAYPVLGRSVVAPPVVCDRARCEEGTDAIVYGQKLQPVLVAADGVVTAVDRGRAVGGAISVTVTDVEGRTYRYSGFNDDSPGTDDGAGHPALSLTVLAQVGRTVRAGQIIGFMGDTDPMPGGTRARTVDGGEPVPVWPHLRLTVRAADGTRLDADALLVAAQSRQACHVGTGPWALPPDPRLTNPDDAELLAYAHAVVEQGGELADHPDLQPDGYPRLEPVEVSTVVDGGFRIAADGTVQAYGASALIRDPLGCEWAPPHAFGAGAAGASAPLAWFGEIELPARYWVTAAVSANNPGLPTGVLVGR